MHIWMPRAPGGIFLSALSDALGADSHLLLDGDPVDTSRVRVYVGGSPTAGELDRCPALETLVIPYAGMPAATRALLRDRRSISVHNLHHNAAATAEMAMALLLAVVKRVVPLDRALREGDWRPRYGPAQAEILDGRTALVLGYGQIGRRVARACLAFGMTVLGVRRAEGPDPTLPAVQIRGPVALDSLWPQADVLIVCLPLTPATEGLVGAAALGALPAGAVVVNVGRGPIIDEAALYGALESGHLGGAGLDVWYQYPADVEARACTHPGTHPFHALEQVVLSPHRGGKTRETERVRAAHLAVLLDQAARGEPLDNAVDVDAGY